MTWSLTPAPAVDADETAWGTWQAATTAVPGFPPHSAVGINDPGSDAVWAATRQLQAGSGGTRARGSPNGAAILTRTATPWSRSRWPRPAWSWPSSRWSEGGRQEPAPRAARAAGPAESRGPPGGAAHPAVILARREKCERNLAAMQWRQCCPFRGPRSPGIRGAGHPKSRCGFLGFRFQRCSIDLRRFVAQPDSRAKKIGICKPSTHPKLGSCHFSTSRKTGKGRRWTSIRTSSSPVLFFGQVYANGQGNNTR